MKELKKYFLDRRFLFPAGFLILFEIFMQSGIYKNFLRPRSYAANVNHIVKTINKSDLRPNILILGTSVAYQGINLPYLNSLLKDRGLSVQSGATEGAMLITQHLIFKSIIDHNPGIKTVLHFSEISFPWTAKHLLDVSNKSMVSQFPRKQSFDLLSQYEYRLTESDYSYLLIKSISYRSDLRDFAFSPLYRIKLLAREKRLPAKDFPYENQYEYSMAVIQAKNLQDCIHNFPFGLPEIDSNNQRITDRMHKEAMFRTCQLAQHDPMDFPGSPQWKDLYFRRLKVFFNDIESRGIRVITVFPPYSQLIKDPRAKIRASVWNQKLDEIRNGKNINYIDLRRSLDGPDNNSLYYDTIHLNRRGSLRLTERLAESIKELSAKGDLLPEN
ncbi:MAG: SGNH/GDSL hydrolase family protein [Spirochaetia bacterium]|nr:SGNH/GDSL hydrolase family protein [Spirochaetia bacterium]